MLLMMHARILQVKENEKKESSRENFKFVKKYLTRCM
jgi:hypothetical protein